MKMTKPVKPLSPLVKVLASGLKVHDFKNASVIPLWLGLWDVHAFGGFTSSTTTNLLYTNVKSWEGSWIIPTSKASV